jgi:hypothetical protein
MNFRLQKRLEICWLNTLLAFQEAGINISIGSSLGHAVAQLVEALLYKPEGSGFDSRWCNWNFSLT